MKKITGMMILAMALTMSACGHMHHHDSCCKDGQCSMDKHDANAKGGCCKDGKCEMPEKKDETKK